MKVITIKQPFATLISEGLKEYEFRTWNTKYRGEILIHAGLGVDEKAMKRYAHLNLEYPRGCIIAKATITDSVYVDNSLKEKLNSKNPLIYYGIINEDSSWNGYGFKLENITKIKRIEVNGSLSLWNYYEPIEIMNLMKDIEYGYIDKNNNSCFKVDNNFSNNYYLQSPKDLIKSKLGVCFDQVELERFYFKNSGYSINTYFIVHYDDDKCPAHTFLTFKKNNSYYWFEHSWLVLRGIHKYNSMNELLTDVKNKFINLELNNNYIDNSLCIYEYIKPKYNLSCLEFYKHCESGKNIRI